ncbi:hypothetical protein V492_08506 [Pseudogymnoascus sp. VKM F-4246]|nr:hypothetical protein V492_08506 [Pseudogymnoascus sp. VKM F-4246]
MALPSPEGSFQHRYDNDKPKKLDDEQPVPVIGNRKLQKKAGKLELPNPRTTARRTLATPHHRTTSRRDDETTHNGTNVTIGLRMLILKHDGGSFGSLYSIVGLHYRYCTPIRATWEVEFATAVGNCINRPMFYFAQAGLGILTDFATVIAPMLIMWRLQLGLKQKLGVGGVLTTGGFVCVISIIRLYSISVLLRSTDLTYDTPPALMWCVVELNMSIVGGCIATFKPFLLKYFPRVLGTSHNPAVLYDNNTGASRSRKRGQSYQLESVGQSDSFNYLASNKKGFVSTTINAADTKYNSSEECIISPGNSSTNGQIVRTVQFGTIYEEGSKDRRKLV